MAAFVWRKIDGGFALFSDKGRIGEIIRAGPSPPKYKVSVLVGAVKNPRVDGEVHKVEFSMRAPFEKAKRTVEEFWFLESIPVEKE
jgi:hypothetical protein